MDLPDHRGSHAWALTLLLAVALGVAILGTRDRVGSWNDASRLAMVECLVDHHTWRIDDSIYVRTADTDTKQLASDPGALPTADRLCIAGHFYSDKTPVPGLGLALLYQAWQWAVGRTVAEWPRGFVYWMTIGSSVLSYGMALAGMAHLFQRLRVPGGTTLLLTASLAFATVAPIYALQVNNHVMLLAVGVAVLLAFERLAESASTDQPTNAWCLILGTALGLGYTIDQGVGPMLLLTAAPLVLYRCRTPGTFGRVVLALAPWLLLHHGINYAIGGSWQPANANPDYLAWPGSRFDAQTMTGTWHHATFASLASYTTKMLLGKQGFIGHDLALWLLPVAAWVIVRRRPREWPEALFAAAWMLGSLGLYAALSRNYGGECRSVRWLVPMLAPAYFLLGVLVREVPRCRADLALLSAWGLLMIATRWHRGPWNMEVGDWYWPIQGLALASWVGWRGLRWRRSLGQAPRFAVGSPMVPRIIAATASHSALKHRSARPMIHGPGRASWANAVAVPGRDDDSAARA